ncbi:tetratricopeptide repeat protein [Streptomyces sp. NPDC088921]|uniref:tetratricopeptide repeat protein n=1 Tax=unclassified Streptomyces TaxID=2593676 RepID=UPI00344052F6
MHDQRRYVDFSDRWTQWPEWRTLFSYGARSAAAVGDRAAEAHQLNCLAWAHGVGAYQYEQAEQLACKALELAIEVGDEGQQAWAWSYISGACLGLRPAEAAAKATRLFEAAGDTAGKAVSQRVLGKALRESGRAEEALALHRALLDTSAGDIPGLNEYIQALLRHEIANDLLALERWPEAVAAYRTVTTPLAHGNLDRFQAQALTGLATALHHCGELPEAREHLTRAYELFRSVGDTTSAAETAGAIERLR